MRLSVFLVLAGTCFSAPAFAASPPDCAGPVEVAHAKIVRIEKNGALILDDGRAAMLEGIRLPLTDGGPPSVADDALAALRTLATTTPLTLTAVPPKEDRYDRVRVEAFGDVWIQAELLRRGLARVAPAADRSECVADFYKAEGEARAAGRGLWAFPAFAIRAAGGITAADEGSFVLVQGKVANGAVHDGRVFLDFSEDYRRGFSATIAPEDHAAFRGTNPPPEALGGRTIRLRGMVEDFGGKPEIALSNPAQIELVQ